MCGSVGVRGGVATGVRQRQACDSAGRGRRIGGGTRKKRERAAVFDEEEEEGIDLRQALALIYQGDLLPVLATSRE